MSKKIFKYPFSIKDHLELKLPIGAWISHIGVQKNVPCMWCEVDPEAGMESRWFTIVGTGFDVPGGDTVFLGTIFIGPLVWHIYENF